MGGISLLMCEAIMSRRTSQYYLVLFRLRDVNGVMSCDATNVWGNAHKVMNTEAEEFSSVNRDSETADALHLDGIKANIVGVMADVILHHFKNGGADVTMKW